jgi:hypothetical protein
MSIAKKIANAHFEDGASWTTRSFSRHGLPKHLKRDRRLRNRIAKHKEERLAFSDQLPAADK